MTIKAIKEEFAKKTRYQGISGGKWQFTVWRMTKKGKCVLCVQNLGGYEGRWVVACISTIDGKDLFHNDHSRPCDNMDDAIDVASEILSSMYAENEFTAEEIEKYGI